ncbi:MAG: PQQ-binding-like beta-propeller repeat protein [Planctomycetes bacterium]|nr:PQQ-binding-like beta-propeller repeat protein [Planctomycetota bacterium]
MKRLLPLLLVLGCASDEPRDQPGAEPETKAPPPSARTGIALPGKDKSFHRDGETVYVLAGDGIAVLDPAQGKVLRTVVAEKGRHLSVQGGRAFISGDKGVAVYDLASEKRTHFVATGAAAVCSAAWKDTLAVATRAGVIEILDIPSGRKHTAIEVSGVLEDVDVSGEHAYFVSRYSGFLLEIHVPTRKEVWRIESVKEWFDYIRVVDGDLAYCRNINGPDYCVYDLRRQAHLRTLKLPGTQSDFAVDVAYSVDGDKVIATRLSDMQVLWTEEVPGALEVRAAGAHVCVLTEAGIVVLPAGKP